MKALLLAALLFLALLLALPLGSSLVVPPASRAYAAEPQPAVPADISTPSKPISPRGRGRIVGSTPEAYVPWDPTAWQERLGSYRKDSLGGQVLRGDRPLPAARVRVWPRNANHEGRDEIPALRETLSDSEGQFLFEGLEFGTYVLRADSGGHFVFSRRNILNPTRSESRGVILLFGSSIIEGKVLDHGVPSAERGIRIAGVYGSSPSRLSRTRTDSSGRFRIEGLACGEYYLYADPGPEGPDPHDSRRVRLAPGETTPVVLGETGPPMRWKGQVLDRAGRATEGEFQLGLVLVGQAGENETTVGSAFSLNIPAGHYEVVWRLDSGHAPLRSQVEVTPAQPQQDLVLPGTCLIARVLDPSGRATSDNGITLAFEQDPESIQPEHLKDGRHQWAPLPQGIFRIRSYRWRFAGDAQGEGVLVHISGAPTQEVTLTAIEAIGPASEGDD